MRKAALCFLLLGVIQAAAAQQDRAALGIGRGGGLSGGGDQHGISTRRRWRAGTRPR